MINPPKKLYSFLFVALFSLTIINNLQAELVCKEPENIETPEQAYYREHPWHFTENWFMKKEEAPVIVETICVIWLTVSVAQGSYYLSKYLLPEPEKDVAFPITFCTSLLTIITATNACINYNKELILKHEVNLLKNLFKNYDPNLESLSHKHYIPKSLHSAFDSMYQGYEESGDKYLEEHAPSLLSLIRDQIKYTIRPKKYASPKVITVPSYYGTYWYRA